MIKAKKLPPLEEIAKFIEYDAETGNFKWRVSRKGHAKAGMTAGAKNPNGYIYIRINKVDYLAHRLAWLFIHQDPGEDMQIDHANGVRHDNRISNLRLSSHAQNRWNSKPRSHNKSGATGVKARGKKWAARIRTEEKEIWLGTYDTIEKAKAAYDKAALELRGKFAKT